MEERPQLAESSASANSPGSTYTGTHPTSRSSAASPSFSSSPISSSPPRADPRDVEPRDVPLPRAASRRADDQAAVVVPLDPVGQPRRHATRRPRPARTSRRLRLLLLPVLLEVELRLQPFIRARSASPSPSRSSSRLFADARRRRRREREPSRGCCRATTTPPPTTPARPGRVDDTRSDDVPDPDDDADASKRPATGRPRSRASSACRCRSVERIASPITSAVRRRRRQLRAHARSPLRRRQGTGRRGIGKPSRAASAGALQPAVRRGCELVFRVDPRPRTAA